MQRQEKDGLALCKENLRIGTLPVRSVAGASPFIVSMNYI